jgi:iron complex transport system substrate-binding protein
MKKNIIGILALIILLTACTSMNSSSTNSAPGQLTDGLGRKVSLSAPAQRIVSLAPSNTEILYAIGCGSQVVGRDEFSDYPEAVKALPSVGGSMGSYDLEAIAALKPDLVIAAGINTPEQVKSLENLGITIYYLSNPTDLDGMYANLRIVAKLCGKQTETDQLIASLKTRVQVVFDKLKNVTEKPLVYYELDGSDPAKPWTPGPNTFLTKLISLAGGKSVGESLTSDYAQISLEELLMQNPDIILLGDSAYGTTADQVASRAGWESLKAVENSQIFPFNDDLVSLPGPRLVDGLEQIALILHPDAFK